MGVHQWHVQAGHSQLWLTPVSTLVGRGGHSEEHFVMKYGGRAGRSRRWREEGNAHPSLLLSHLTNKQTPDSRCQSLKLIQVGFLRPPQPVELQRVSLLRAGRPIRCPCLPLCMTLGSSYYNIYTQNHQKTNSWPMPLTHYSACHHSLLKSNPFYFNVDSIAVNWVLLALLSIDM